MPNQGQAVWLTIADQDASDYYVGRSLTASRTVGSERDTFSFRLHVDADDHAGGWPAFLPSSDDLKDNTEREVLIKDNLGNLMLRGRIKRMAVETRVPVATGYVNVFSLTCQGLDRDLDSRPFSEFWENKTPGWIARDVAQRFCPSWVSVASIETAAPPGRTLKAFEALNKKPGQVLDQLAAIQGWEWYLDEQRALHFEPPSDAAATFWLTDDADLIAASSVAEPWRDVADVGGRSLTVEPDSTNLANVITLLYQTRYNTGTAAIDAALPTRIEGSGVAWLGYITPESVFRLDGFEGSYPITEVKESGGLQILTLGSPLATSIFTALAANTKSGMAYEISQIPAAIEVADHDSIAAMATITGETGVTAGRRERLVDTQAHYSIEEARDRALAELGGLANPLVNISFKTNSSQLTTPPKPGQYVKFNFSGRYVLAEELAIRSVAITDLGATEDDGRALLEYAISFETRLYSFSKAIRKYEEAADTQGTSLKDPKRLAQLRSVVERLGLVDGMANPKFTEVNPPFRWSGGTTFSVATSGDWLALFGAKDSTEVVLDNGLGVEVLQLTFGQVYEWVKATNNTHCATFAASNVDQNQQSVLFNAQVAGVCNVNKPTNNTKLVLQGVFGYAGLGFASTDVNLSYNIQNDKWQIHFGGGQSPEFTWQNGLTFTVGDRNAQGEATFVCEANPPGTWPQLDTVNFSSVQLEKCRFRWGATTTATVLAWPAAQQQIINAGNPWGTATFTPDATPPSVSTTDSVDRQQVNEYAASGYWQSKAVALKTRLDQKTLTMPYVKPAGSTIVLKMRLTADLAGATATPWQTVDLDAPAAALQALGDWVKAPAFSWPAKYFQFRLELTPGGDGLTTPKIKPWTLDPDEADTTWGLAEWGPLEQRFDADADFAAGTFSQTQVDAGQGRVIIAPGQGYLSGTWTSPWIHSESRTATKEAALSTTVVAGQAVVVDYRSAFDTSGLQASAWGAAIADVPEAPFYQVRATLTAVPQGLPALPSLNSVVIDPK